MIETKNGKIIYTEFELGYQQGREDAITDFMCKALTKFYNFDLEHGYPTHADVKDILLDVSNELKEQK